MKTIARSIALLAVAFALALPPAAQAGPGESHVYTHNTTDNWVWITAYEPKPGSYDEINRGAWCVHPHSYDKHGLHAHIRRVRAEVTVRNCAHPVVADLWTGFNDQVRVMEFTLTEKSGKFSFSGSVL
jgi:hypothetical protein